MAPPIRESELQEALRLSEERYRSLVEATAFTWTAEPSGALVSDIPQWRAITGQTVDELLGHGWIEAIHPEDRDRVTAEWAAAVRDRNVYATEYRIGRQDGGWTHLFVRGAPVLDADGDVREFVGLCYDVTERAERQERERRLLAELAEERAILAEIIAGAPAGVALLWGPELRYRLHNDVYRDMLPAGREVLGRPVAEAVPEAAEALPILRRVRRSGETVRLDDYGVPFDDPRALDGYRYYTVTLSPVRGDDAIEGVLVVGVETTDEVRKRRRLEDELRHERQLAETLQRSLLPEPADLARVDAAVRYLPAEAGSAVGGDFYDAFVLPGGELVVTIGDIAGRGIEAARLMGQMRAALRAFALEGRDPAAVLGGLSRFFEAQGQAEMATVFVARLTADRRSIEWANAGHLPALLAAPGAEPVLLHGALAPPIGITGELPATQRASVAPGATLLLYTDGLVEDRERSLEEGLARLKRVMAAGHRDAPAELCDRVVAELLPARDRQDDVAVLALRTPQ